MRISRFTESQIVKVLKEVEGGRQVMEVCREYGISAASYYNWKAENPDALARAHCYDVAIQQEQRTAEGLHNKMEMMTWKVYGF